MPTKPDLVYLPLGGAGEIGMNLYLYGFGDANSRQWIAVDFGIGFSGAFPGVDVIMPDIGFLEGDRIDLIGIVLTHAHEDHYGALATLWPRLKAPVFTTKFTAAMLKGRLEEFGLEETVPVTILEQSARFTIGPFDLELVDVAHSIPEPNALVIRTAAGTVLHTGDWKIDDTPVIGSATDKTKFQAIGKEGVEAMICDSTNVFRPGTSISESEVAKNLKRVVAEQPGRVIVTTFSSNVGRLLSIVAAARAAERDVVLAGRAIWRIIDAARETGYLRGDERFLGEKDFGFLPPEKALAIVTGSQGESRAALGRIAGGTHSTVAVESGDTVIFSSRVIPGNETEVGRIENQLAARGVRVIDADQEPVHVTGHPRRDELRQMYEWVRPKVAVPMHGEMRHLVAHAAFAESLGVTRSLVVPNGVMARLTPEPAALLDTVESGRLLRDGELIIPETDRSVRDRRRLSNAGAVFVSVVMDERGEILIDPDIVVLGLPEHTDDGQEFEAFISETVDEALDALPRARRSDADHAGEQLRRAVRSDVETVWGKKPEVHVSVSQL